MKKRKWIVALALLLCFASAMALPNTVAYIADKANTIRNTFRVVYRPAEDVYVPVRVQKTIHSTGKETITPEGFVFALKRLDNGQMDVLTAAKDGCCSSQLIFTAEDVNKTYRYQLYEINTEREYVTYDERVYEVSVSLHLDDQHKMYATLTVDGVETDAIIAEFVNLYEAVEIPDTGDHHQPVLWLLMMLGSCAGLLLIRKKWAYRRA